MIASHILSIVTFLPLFGAAAILLTSGSDAVVARNARWIALITTIVEFAISIYLWVKFDGSIAAFQFVEQADWLGPGIGYHMGVDGISMLFIVLTCGLMPFCILASWESIETRVAEYMVAFLALQALMIGVFCALDLVLFYAFFEFGLAPWDVAAGLLVVREAGGLVTDIAGQPYELGGPSVLASNFGMRDPMVEILSAA